MESYRHVNILVGERIYDALKEASFKRKQTVSEIVRNGIVRVLKNPECKCGEVKNDNR